MGDVLLVTGGSRGIGAATALAAARQGYDVCLAYRHRSVDAAAVVKELGPRARPSPTNEAIVAGGVRTEVVRQIAPWRSRSQDPEDAIEDATIIHPRHAARLVR